MKITEKGLARKAQIIQTAIGILSTEGRSGFSMRGIAEACGLRLSNVQYYFSSLEELFCEILEYIFQDSKSRLEQSIAEGNGVLETILYMIFNDMEEQPDCQLLYEIWAISAQFEKTNETVVGFYQSYLDLLANTIQTKNSNLTKDEAQKKAEIILPLLEGLCLVYGKGRKQKLAPELEKNITESIQSIIDM